MPRRTPHLLVRVRDGNGLVGPMVVPGVTSCLRCADLHRSDHDAAWPAVAAQLRDTVGTADRATVLATAALAVNQVDRVLRAIRGDGRAVRRPSAVDAGHDAGVRRRRELDRLAAVGAAPALLVLNGCLLVAQALIAFCCHFVVGEIARSGMMVRWQTSNVGAPPAMRSSQALVPAWPAGPRWASASG